MSEWLSKLHEFCTEGDPFVIATVTSLHGNSPEQIGAYTFVSKKHSSSVVSSESRRKHMLATSRSVLNAPTSFSMEQHALGHVAGTINGHCFITYEFFPATDYPDWLKELRGHLQTGTSSILLREFNHVDENVQSRVISGNAIKQAAEIADFVEQSPPKDCVLINNENSTVFLRAVRSREIPLVLVGDHPVTAKIAQQVAALPIVLSKIKTEDMVNPVWPEQLAPQSYVIIMTGDHELDFRLCQIALNYQNLKFIGCIGSNKKAQFFHHRLKQQGATEEQLKKLTMPIGLPQINGKQTAVIAASIVAQIMSLHHW